MKPAISLFIATKRFDSADGAAWENAPLSLSPINPNGIESFSPGLDAKRTTLGKVTNDHQP